MQLSLSWPYWDLGTSVTLDEVLDRLRALSRPDQLEGMARYGINTETALAVRIPELRKLAKTIGCDHELAGELWATGIHEARILAAMVDDPEQVSDEQLESWVAKFNSWDLCDQVCSNLFDKTAFAWDKAHDWAAREETFVKRAGFTLMACLAVHDKRAKNPAFETFFPVIEREATDPRNYVRKAVNWALRQIGKRNRPLNMEAIVLAKKLAAAEDRTAKWIGRDALDELTSEKAQARLPD